MSNIVNGQPVSWCGYCGQWYYLSGFGTMSMDHFKEHLNACETMRCLKIAKEKNKNDESKPKS